MNIRIVGPGAIGTVVAAKLSKAADVSFIIGESRLAKYSSGISLNGEVLDIPIAKKEDGPSDLIIYTVKNFSLEDAIEDSEPFVSDSTVFLPLLNGIEAEGVLEKYYSGRVLYGFITNISAVHSGTQTSCFSGSGIIVFSEKDNSAGERVMRIAEVFEKSGQKYEIPKDIMHEKWWKFMLNTCFNTISAIISADYSEISGNRDFIRAARVTAGEVQEVAAKEGVIITGDDIERMIASVTSLNDHGKTSMLQDVEEGRETENRYFAGAVSRLGRKHSIKTPICDFLSILLEARRNVR